MSAYQPQDLGARCTECPLKDCGPPVPPEANPDAILFAVGRSPGPHERKAGRPYVGPAGHRITQAFGAVGVPREKVHWTNVVACVPPAQDLKSLTARINKANAKAKREHVKAKREWIKANKGGQEPTEGGQEPVLSLQLTPQEACRPRLMAELAASGLTNIVPMGTDAAKTLLGPHASITAVRGGMVPANLRYDPKANQITVYGRDDDAEALPGFTCVRILPIFEPAFVLRFPRWSKAFAVDIGRAVAWFNDTLEFKDPTIIYHPKPDVLQAFLDKPGAVYAYDVETDGIECLTASMRCIAIGDADTVVVVGLRDKDLPPLPLHSERITRLLSGEGDPQTSMWYTSTELPVVLDILCKWLADPTKVKVGHNAGVYDYGNCYGQFGVRSRGIMDTLQLHRLVEPELPHNLGFVASIYAPAVKAWKADRDGRKIALEAESNEELHAYCATDVSCTARVLGPLMKAVEVRGQRSIIAKDHRVQNVCIRMHEIGMRVDQKRRAEYERAMVTRAVTLRDQLRGLAGDPDFNPGSRDQLGALLFDKWKLNPPIDDDEILYTESGAISTGDPVLRSLLMLPKLKKHQRDHINLTRQYRKTQKMLGTYVAKLRPMAVDANLGWDDDEDPEDRAYRLHYNYDKKGATWADGRVHPGFNNLTRVGRLNGGKPLNALNFPAHLRDMIVPEPGHCFVYVDADQFHIRIFGALWGVRKYLDAFELGADAHCITADACFPQTNKPGLRFREMEGFPGGTWHGDCFVPDGTGKWGGDAKATRGLSKSVGFASAYAAGVETVHRTIQKAEDQEGNLIYLSLTMPEVRVLHGNWLRSVPELRAGWMTEEKLFDAHGYLADPVWGRRQDFLDGPTKQELANSRVLCAEASLMNDAMLRVVDAVPWGKWGPNTGLINQNYDSMVFEVPADGVHEVDGDWKASPGTPAWEVWHLLADALNYDGATVGLPGVQFTGPPSIGFNWRDLG